MTKRFELPKSLADLAKTEKGRALLNKAAMGEPQTMEERDADIFPREDNTTALLEEGNYEEHQYLSLLNHILENGQFKEDRTGVGCYSVFGEMMRFDLTGGKIPLLTTKKMGIKSIIHELLWFLNGDTNNAYLKDNKVHIWDEWALENGDLGPIYGKQWTAWEAPDLEAVAESVEDLIEENQATSKPLDPEMLHNCLLKLLDRVQNPPKINQIQELITSLKENPTSRRMLVTAWNPSVLPNDYKWEYCNLFDFDPVTGNRKVIEDPSSIDTRYTRFLSEDERINFARVNGTLNTTLTPDGWSFSCPEDTTPTHRRWMKMSPQDNVKEGRAALPACHTMFQVHTRELSVDERLKAAERRLSDDSVLDELFGLAIGGVTEGGEQDAINQEVIDYLDKHDVPKRALTLQFYARSQDTALGTPYNLASYGTLAHMLAQSVGMVAEELVWMGGDCHIYRGQIEGVKTQLEREPRPWPTLKINPEKNDIFSFTIDDFELIDYQHHPKIDFGPVAV